LSATSWVSRAISLIEALASRTSLIVSVTRASAVPKPMTPPLSVCRLPTASARVVATVSALAESVARVAEAEARASSIEVARLALVRPVASASRTTPVSVSSWRWPSRPISSMMPTMSAISTPSRLARSPMAAMSAS
jgi:hypothetical protein